METIHEDFDSPSGEKAGNSHMDQLSDLPSFEEHIASMSNPVLEAESDPTPEVEEKKHRHDHTPSRHPAFLRAQSIARKEGQRMVDDHKRDYVYTHEISQRLREGEDINDILEETNGDGVYLHAEEFLDNGADIEKVFEYMPKDTRWLKIDELVAHGYDINKLADKLSDTAIWLNADKFVKYGADLDRLKRRLSSKSEFFKSLIDSGELFGDTPKQ